MKIEGDDLLQLAKISPYGQKGSPVSDEVKQPVVRFAEENNKQFYFNLRAANGEMVVTSETGKTQAGANNGIASVEKNGPNCLRDDMKMDKRGQYYFILKAANHQVIGKSKSYTTATNMEKGIKVWPSFLL